MTAFAFYDAEAAIRQAHQEIRVVIGYPALEAVLDAESDAALILSQPKGNIIGLIQHLRELQFIPTVKAAERVNGLHGITHNVLRR